MCSHFTAEVPVAPRAGSEELGIVAGDSRANDKLHGNAGMRVYVYIDAALGLTVTGAGFAHGVVIILYMYMLAKARSSLECVYIYQLLTC